MKKNFLVAVGIGVVFLTFTFLFYWFEIRTGNIRKSCIEDAYDGKIVDQSLFYSRIKEDDLRLAPDGGEPFLNLPIQNTVPEKVYEHCLHYNGLTN